MIRLSLFAAVLLLAGCSKNIDTTDAVRQGVMDYYSSIAPKIGLDLSNMQVDVSAVTFEKDHARATVSIKPKNLQTGGTELAYNLDRQGDKWVVHGNAAAAGSMHGSQDGSQPGAGALPPAQDGTALPPGHPGVGAASGASQGGTALPPGHPAVPATTPQK